MTTNALKSRNFLIFLCGNLFSLHALWMMRVAVGWIAWDMTGSASYVGVVVFLYFAPSMVTGPLFGVLTDRVNLRTAALLTQSLMMGLAVALLILQVTGNLELPLLMGHAVLSGMAMAAYGPIRMSLAPRLVAAELVGSVVNITAINFNLARLTGPAIGGAMIATFGISATLGLIALCYLPFLYVLKRVDIRPRRSPRTGQLPFLRSLAEGLRYTVQWPVVRQAMALTALSASTTRATLEILPVLADGVFGKGAAGLGLVTSAAGLGALSGGALLFLMPPRSDTVLPPWSYLVMLVAAIGTLSLGQTTSWHLALGLVALIASCGTTVAVLCQSAIQGSIDDDFRGRVMSLWAMVAVGASAIGAAILGGLIDLFGSANALATCGFVGAFGVFALVLLRRLVR